MAFPIYDASNGTVIVALVLVEEFASWSRIHSVEDHTMNALIMFLFGNCSSISSAVYSLGTAIIDAYAWPLDFFTNFVSSGISTVIVSSPVVICVPLMIVHVDSKIVGVSSCPLFCETSSDMLHCALSPRSVYQPLIRSDLISSTSVVVGITIVLHHTRASHPVYSIAS
jgi:hypothetical protein